MEIQGSSLDLNPGVSGLPMNLVTAKVAVIEAGRALCMSGSSGNPDAQLWGLEKGSVVGGRVFCHQAPEPS